MMEAETGGMCLQAKGGQDSQKTLEAAYTRLSVFYFSFIESSMASREEFVFGISQPCSCLVMPFSGSVVSGKLFKLFEPPFPSL